MLDMAFSSAVPFTTSEPGLFYGGGGCECVCVCACVCVRLCLCGLPHGDLLLRAERTPHTGNLQWRVMPQLSSAKKCLAGFLWGRSPFLDSGGRGRSLGRILTISGGGWERFENGVQPCGWGASPDIPNPPGLSREVFAMDGRAGLDIPKSSGTVT